MNNKNEDLMEKQDLIEKQDLMEKRDFLNELYDLFGGLLTEKQQSCFQLYYQEDLSLAEIAEEEGISRNAVYDHLKRAEALLLGTEEKLGLYKRLQVTRQDLEKVMAVMEEIEEENDWEQLPMIRTYLKEIAENI